MKTQVALRVVRGPDWEWGDQDGGEGHVGTVVEVGEPSVSDGGRAVVVQWDCGERCKYRCGLEGKYDLRVLDNAPTGHDFGPYSICHGCMQDVIRGFGWKCTCCIHYTLCSSCYFSGKHLLDHRFARFDSINLRSWVPLRSESNSVMARGMFPGARVKAGPDWEVEGDNKDAVGEIINDTSKNFKNTVSVKWEKTGDVSECSIGNAKGKVDIVCVVPAFWGLYYPDHLPVLGAPNTPPKEDEIMAGDLVQVQLDVEVFKVMQNEEHGGWNDRMAIFVGRLGKVDHINDQGNLVVCYHGELKKWVLNPDVVVKVDVPDIGPDEAVRVLDDAEKVMSLQLSSGLEWTEDTYDCLGKIGRMKGSDSAGVVSIMIGHKEYILSPLCVQEESDEQSDSCVKVQADPELVLKVHSLLAEGNPAVLAHAAQLGDEHVIREYLKNFPNEVNSKVDGKAPIHWVIQANNIDALKCLLEHNADINILDDFCQSPLHYCIVYSSFKISDKVAQLLLDAGADPNMKGMDGLTPILKAVAARDIKTLRVLVSHPKTDVNKEDEDGETPLHSAVLQHLETPVKLLLSAGADPTHLNKKMNTALHLACNVGNVGALNEILSHDPKCINLKDTTNGCTPLHCAILNSEYRIVAYLLQQPSCDINAKTDINRTPLHGAVIKGDARIVELLVGHGADLSVQDHEMATPLHILTHLTGAHAGLGSLGLGGLDLPGSKVPDFLKGHLPLPGLNPLESVAQFKISDKTPQILRVQEMLGRDVNTKAAVACFLIQEGASLQPRNILGHTPLEGCTDPVLATVIATFAEGNAGKGTFYGSLRNSAVGPPVTSSLKLRKLDPKEGNTKKNLSDQFVSNSDQSGNEGTVNIIPAAKLCELCDEEPISIKFLPCGHAVLCRLCAVRAVKCLECKKPITLKENI